MAKSNIEDALYTINHRILDLQEKLTKYRGIEINSQKELIDFQYTEKELPKAFALKKVLQTSGTSFQKNFLKKTSHLIMMK